MDKRSSAVRQLIIRVSDQLAAGGIKLIEVTPEASVAAKERLESHRKKRRERHAKKETIPLVHRKPFEILESMIYITI